MNRPFEEVVRVRPTVDVNNGVDTDHWDMASVVEKAVAFRHALIAVVGGLNRNRVIRIPTR